MTKLKGDAPNTMSVLVDGATNRLSGLYFSYAYNGTALTMPGWQGTYDNEGRLTDVTQTQNGTESYEYDPANHLVWSTQRIAGATYGTSYTYMFYGVDGRRLMPVEWWVVNSIGGMYGGGLKLRPGWAITYFLGQVVTGEGGRGAYAQVPANSMYMVHGAAMDRLGSARSAPYPGWSGTQVKTSSYFPYGQPRTGGSTWATYAPSATSGTMYAMNREYSQLYGRFLQPDPYQASGGPADPASWNRYAYVQGDPVNRFDPRGLYYHFAYECLAARGRNHVGRVASVAGPKRGVATLAMRAIEKEPRQSVGPAPAQPLGAGRLAAEGCVTRRQRCPASNPPRALPSAVIRPARPARSLPRAARAFDNCRLRKHQPEATP